MVHYQNCPLCRSQEIQFVLHAKDHTVTQQTFEILGCANCGVRFTQDVPGKDEIGPYYRAKEYISHTGSKEGFLNKLYHLVRRQTLKSKRKLIEEITGFRFGTLLDVGCGTGDFLHSMQLAGWQITGIEPDDSARAVASKLCGLEIGPSEQLYQLPHASYDTITLWHVLEHVHDLHGYLDKLRQMIKPGGKIFIAVPNYTSHDAEAYGAYWAAYDVPRHLYHFSPESMKMILVYHQLNLLSTRPMWFDSFYVSLLSEKYRTGRSNYARAIWNGFRSNYIAYANKSRCSSIIYVAEKFE